MYTAKEQIREAVLDTRAMWQMLHINSEYVFDTEDKAWALDELGIMHNIINCPMCSLLAAGECYSCLSWEHDYETPWRFQCLNEKSSYYDWCNAKSVQSRFDASERIIGLCDRWLIANGYNNDVEN